jgi:hypothetical protein
LKPPLLEDFELTYEETKIAVHDIWLKLLDVEWRRSGTIAVQIAVQVAADDDSIRKVQDGALLAIESYIGERAFGMLIRHYEFEKVPFDPLDQGFIQLPDLAAMLGINRIQ